MVNARLNSPGSKPSTTQNPSGIREIIREKRRKKQEAKLAYYFCSGVIIGIVIVVFMQGFVK